MWTIQRFYIFGISLLITSRLCFIAGANDTFVPMGIIPYNSTDPMTFICNSTIEYTEGISSITFLSNYLANTKSISVPCYCILNHQENNTELDELELLLRRSTGGTWPVWITLTSDDWENMQHGLPRFEVLPDKQYGAKFIIFSHNNDELFTRDHTVVYIGGVHGKVNLRCSPDNYPYRTDTTSVTSHFITSTTISLSTAAASSVSQSATGKEHTTAYGTRDFDNTTFMPLGGDSDKINSENNSTTIIIAAVVGALGLVIVSVIIVVLAIKCRKSNSSNQDKQLSKQSDGKTADEIMNNNDNYALEEAVNGHITPYDHHYSYANEANPEQVVEYEQAGGVQYTAINIGSSPKKTEKVTENGEMPTFSTYADVDVQDTAETTVNDENDNQSSIVMIANDIYGDNDIAEPTEHEDAGVDTVQDIYAQPIKKKDRNKNVSPRPEETSRETDVSELYAQPIKGKKK